MLKSLNKQLGCLPNCLIIDNGTTEFIDDKNAIYFMGVESNAKQNLENFSTTFAPIKPPIIPPIAIFNDIPKSK